MKRLGISTLLALMLIGASCLSSSAAEKQVRVLMITQSKGFTHGSVRRPEGKLAPAEIAMTQLGQQSKLFKIDCSQNCEADFTQDHLENYDVVMFYTTGVLPISDEARDYFINDWLKQKGHGFIGFHSATDTFKKQEWYYGLIGGSFNGHPWNAGNTVTVTVHDTAFPAMKPFGAEYQIKDEIYQYVNWRPENVRVLASLNMAKCNPKKPYHVPLSWVKNWGQGRMFYTNLGHNPGTWTDKRFIDSMEIAVKWVTGQIEGDATPNPEVSKAQEAKAKADAGE